MQNTIDSAMIFAAGLGLRMRPLTERTPKPLIKVGNKKLIDYTINMLDEAKIHNKIINSFYLSEQIDEYFKDRKNIIIVNEKNRLETGGGLKNALPLLNSKNIISVNSDVILQYKINPVTQLIKDWNENKFDILMLIVKKENAIGYDGDGDFEIDNNGYLTKPKNKNYVFTGLQIINTSILQNFEKKVFSLSEVFSKSLNNKRLGGIIHDGNMLHVGDIKGLNMAQRLI